MTAVRKAIALIVLFLCVVGAEAQTRRPSVALVLSGGGARGFAHIVALEVIEELGIPLDMIVGVSSGAIIGGLYAAGHSPAMILEALKNRDWTSFFDDRPVSPFRNRNEDLPVAIGLGNPMEAGTLGITPVREQGFSTGQIAYQLFRSQTIKIPSHMDFDDLPIPFRAGTVEVPSGRFRLLESGDLAEAIRASMSIQGVFEPVVIDGRSYTDGGLLNNLPIREVREMGFDIVIAVDLFPPLRAFSVAPADLPDQISILYFNLKSSMQHHYADAVLFPLLKDVSAMDFARGREIYALADRERGTLAAILEPIRQRIAAYPSGETAVRSYAAMPYLTPQSMSLTGALPRDRPSIERAFSRLIKGRPLQAENMTAFLQHIYETGNYRLVTARTDTRGEETRLEIILHPEAQNRILLRAGLDYEGTLSFRSSARTALRSGVEFLGPGGFSLLLKASVLDELSVGFSMLQPLGPHLFTAAEAELVRDQNLSPRGILNQEEIGINRLLYFRGMLKGGLRFNSRHSLALWPEYFWFRDDEQQHTLAGIGAAYTYTSLNHPLFPSRGFWGRIEHRFRIEPNSGGAPFHLLSIGLKAALPLNNHLSITAAAHVSSLFGETELSPRLSAFGLADVQRHYFPHARDLFCGERRAALSLALRFQPRENLTILGGHLIFSLAGSAGRSGSFAWDALTEEEPIWNASFGVAFVPLHYLGIQLRAGAGGGGGLRPAPFLSLDVGMSGLRKRLFP